MRLRTCPREKEVKELAERGQWPQACAPELRAHVDSCRACRELALVTTAFRRARNEDAGAAWTGTPGVLWWQAQLRRREAAVERIGRPILGAQIFALAVNLLLAGGMVAWQARHGLAWLIWLRQVPRTALQNFDFQWLGTFWVLALSDSGWNRMLLVFAAATLALLGGVAVYLGSAEQ